MPATLTQREFPANIERGFAAREETDGVIGYFVYHLTPGVVEAFQASRCCINRVNTRRSFRRSF